MVILEGQRHAQLKPTEKAPPAERQAGKSAARKRFQKTFQIVSRSIQRRPDFGQSLAFYHGKISKRFQKTFPKDFIWQPGFPESQAAPPSSEPSGLLWTASSKRLNHLFLASPVYQLPAEPARAGLAVLRTLAEPSSAGIVALSKKENAAGFARARKVVGGNYHEGPYD